jgi:hypothetical protein
MSEDTTTPPAAANSNSSKQDDSNSKSTNESTSKDASNRDQFRVQVKPQYLVSERPSILAPIEPKPDKDTASSSNSNNDNGGKNNKGKKRGQNKKRPRDTKISSAQKACLQVIKGESCPFENCKYNHDLKEMLANRLPDLCEEEGVDWLRGECPNWKLNG